jgi:hypothetical protein
VQFASLSIMAMACSGLSLQLREMGSCNLPFDNQGNSTHSTTNENCQS